MRLTSETTSTNGTHHYPEVFTYVTCIPAMADAVMDYYATIEDRLRQCSSLPPNVVALEPFDKRNIERCLQT